MRLLTSRTALIAPIYGLIAFSALSGCHQSGNGSGGTNPDVAQVITDEDAKPTPGRIVVPAGDLRVSNRDNSKIELPNGQYIAVELINGVQYITVEGAIEHTSFTNIVSTARARSTSDKEFNARVAKPLNDSLGKISGTVGGLSDVRVIAKYGFFSAKLKLESYQLLANIEKLPVDIVINPVVVTPVDDRSIRKMELPMASIADARAATEAFSGLKSMGVDQFLADIKNEISSTPDGSSVNVGVVDTGITYNHPSFEDAAGNSRIKYMKDFTGEGRLYFNPAAKFEASASTENDELVIIKAQYVALTAGAASKPRADQLVTPKQDLNALVSPELKALLLNPASGARLAAMSEAQFANESEKVDINANGKTTDTFFAIIVNSGDGYKVFLDVSAELDFRKINGVSNFNTSGDLIKVGSEKFGLDIAETTLLNSEGKEVSVIGASIVGYDPGNHGSHVTGIIGGRKTISNDSDATMARGVAPNAPLMVNRVCANTSGCVSTEAVIDLSEAGAEIVNMSLGGLSAYNDGYSVSEIIIDRLVEANNTVFVISAGNSGPGINTVGSPSTARLALSVGATASRTLIERQYQWPGTGKKGAIDLNAPKADDDFMLFFSSRGPSAAGGFKPNIAAPGTELSAIQLNAAHGARAGLDVYWGTSMAAPAATGAIALLKDAANRYNQENPGRKLPVDAMTITKVIIASARPFDAKLFNPETGEYSNGQYTWIDQGTGMINLPNAWAALKAERDSKIPSGVYAQKDGVRENIEVDYQIRVLRANPNGINYDGSIALPADMMAVSGPRFGRGVWLDSEQTDSLVKVQVARRLPFSASSRDDAADLKRLLITSKDEFAVKTVIYGSNKEWVKAGTLNQLDCVNSPAADLTVIGEGAVDNFEDPTGRSTATNDSTLMLCVDRATIAALPAGDHGALIKLYRKDGDKIEANPAVIVPVYITVPHKTLAGSAGYEVSSSVQSFGVDRNYVRVPKGVNLVKVTLEVPAAKTSEKAIESCQGVRLYAYEGGNTALPADIAGTKAIASNCDEFGRAKDSTRTVTYTRLNPREGIWDLHVFGRYQFAQSDYKLTVEYAKIEASVSKIEGDITALNGSLDLLVVDASLPTDPSSEKSTYKLSGFSQVVESQVETGKQVIVPDADGVMFRKFSDNVVSASFTTGGSAGNDIDLHALECETENLATCAVLDSSTTATDAESVTFTPAADKFYVALVVGYETESGGSKFDFTETRSLKESDAGSLTISKSSESLYKVDFGFDVANSALLKSELFVSGKYSVVGTLLIKSETDAVMVSIPVKVNAQATP